MTEPARAAGDPPDALRPSVLLGLLLSTALVPLGSTMIAVALPSMGRELAQDTATLTQWLVNSYLVVGIVLLSPGGKLGDLWGGRRALVLGQALMAAGSLLGVTAASLAQLVGARAAMAAGGALIGPATMALLRNSTPPGRRARVFGGFGAVMGAAAALGPLFGGMLVQSFGWRAIFLANIPVLVAAAPLVRGVGASPPRRPDAPPFDWVGSALVAAGLATAVAGSKLPWPASGGLLVVGVAVLAAFVAWERRVPEPVLDPALFRRTAFAAGGAVILLHNVALYSLLFQLPLWFGDVLGSGAAEVGRVLLVMTLAMVVCAPLGGRVSERLGARAVVVAGTVAALAGLLLLTDLGGFARPGDAALALALLGAGIGLAGGPTQASALGAVAASESGMASATLSVMRSVGGVVGVAILGLLLRGVATAGEAAALAAHRTALWTFCGAMLLAALPAALLPGRPAAVRENEAPPSPI